MSYVIIFFILLPFIFLNLRNSNYMFFYLVVWGKIATFATSIIIGNAEGKNPEYRIGGCDSDGVAGGTATGCRSYSQH